MRKLLFAVVGVLLIALAVDFGAAIFTEYRISRAIRHGTDLNDDPEVSISGFPFLAQPARGRIGSMTVRAREVPSRTVGSLVVEATFTDVRLPQRGMTVSGDDVITIGRTEADLIIGQTSLGQMLGVPDLEMSAPSADASDGTGGTGGAGLVAAGPSISPNKVLLTGTVQTGQTESGKPKREKVSVLVQLVLDDDRVHIIPAETYPVSGPLGESDTDLPSLEVAGAPFAATISVDELPFDLTPTSVHARGSELVISGRGEDNRLGIEDLLRTGSDR